MWRRVHRPVEAQVGATFAGADPPCPRQPDVRRAVGAAGAAMRSAYMGALARHLLLADAQRRSPCGREDASLRRRRGAHEFRAVAA